MEASSDMPASTPEKKKGKFLKTAILGIAGVFIILLVIVIGGSCCAIFTFGMISSSDKSSNDNSVPVVSYPASTPTNKPTATLKPTATPKPLSGYDLYSTWDVEQIKANAQKVDWEDFMRNTDDYKGKLIMIHGNVVSAVKVGNHYSYDVNINPNLMSDTPLRAHTNNYNPQFISFDYGAKLIEGDIIDLYGVYEGETDFLTQYPIIKGVYVVYYTK